MCTLQQKGPNGPGGKKPCCLVSTLVQIFCLYQGAWWEWGLKLT